jgi:hypothetical protein
VARVQRLGAAARRRPTFTSHGTRLRATAAVRTGVPVGTALRDEGIATGSANALTDATITVPNPWFDHAYAGAEGNQ